MPKIARCQIQIRSRFTVAFGSRTNYIVNTIGFRSLPAVTVHVFFVQKRSVQLVTALKSLPVQRTIRYCDDRSTPMFDDSEEPRRM